MLPRKTDMSDGGALFAGTLPTLGWAAGITTPHSQLRQLSLGLPVFLSLVKRPLEKAKTPSGQLAAQYYYLDEKTRTSTYHALSERLADPT